MHVSDTVEIVTNYKHSTNFYNDLTAPTVGDIEPLILAEYLKIRGVEISFKESKAICADGSMMPLDVCTGRRVTGYTFVNDEFKLSIEDYNDGDSPYTRAGIRGTVEFDVGYTGIANFNAFCGGERPGRVVESLINKSMSDYDYKQRGKDRIARQFGGATTALLLGTESK
ncbi:MAG: hypothetical protein J4431_01215 [Candidatus Aenigmarchaeota archaeon]|nr:hypothetical protein [Candidatus Aenigmarchaeota archaeon]